MIDKSISFEEAVNGAKRDIKVNAEDECDNCHGQGGFNAKTCPECKGSGSVTRQQSTLFGSFLTKTTCPNCSGSGTSFERMCTDCHGSGRVNKERTLTVTIPKGVDTGNRLRIAGKGEAGINGGDRGDLYIEFTVKEDDFYERDGNDIYIVVPLTITEAVLGCKKEIPTIYGKIELTIPEGTKNNNKLRLKGKGIDSDINGKKGEKVSTGRVFGKIKEEDFVKKLRQYGFVELNEEILKKYIDAFLDICNVHNKSERYIKLQELLTNRKICLNYSDDYKGTIRK